MYSYIVSTAQVYYTYLEHISYMLCLCKCVCLCVWIPKIIQHANKQGSQRRTFPLLTKRKPGASSYPQNTEYTLTNGASLFTIKGELIGCKASPPFATLLRHAELAALDLGLCPQLGQTGLNGAVTICATEDWAFGMRLRKHLTQPPPSACTSSLWQPHFTMDGRPCTTGGSKRNYCLL